MGVGVTPAWSQETPDAFEQGVEAFQEGRLSDALSAFDDVDAESLTPEQQARLAQMQADIAEMQAPVDGAAAPAMGSDDDEAEAPVLLPAAEDLRSDGELTAAELLYDADAATSRGDEDEARRLYTRVLNSGADAISVETARVRLAYMDRIATEDPAAAAQGLIEGAVNDIRRETSTPPKPSTTRSARWTCRWAGSRSSSSSGWVRCSPPVPPAPAPSPTTRPLWTAAAARAT